MGKFIIEVFSDGELLTDEIMESNQRLLNERDLDIISMGKERGMLFVRENHNVTHGYYMADDNRWCYGSVEDALNTIKRRI